MSVGDPIADLLTRIRNGQMAKARFVEVPVSKMKLAIVKLLKEQGYIGGFLVREGIHGCIRIYLKYGEGRIPVIQGLKRISKSSCRKYVTHRNLPRVFGGMGVSILSTSRGVMVDRDARKEGIGGEVLCYVW